MISSCLWNRAVPPSGSYTQSQTHTHTHIRTLLYRSNAFLSPPKRVENVRFRPDWNDCDTIFNLPMFKKKRKKIRTRVWEIENTKRRRVEYAEKKLEEENAEEEDTCKYVKRELFTREERQRDKLWRKPRRR